MLIDSSLMTNTLCRTTSLSVYMFNRTRQSHFTKRIIHDDKNQNQSKTKSNASIVTLITILYYKS